jgi:hypothetical protein
MNSAERSHPCRRRHDLATLQANQEILCRVEWRETLNPFHFFERLFR